VDLLGISLRSFFDMTNSELARTFRDEVLRKPNCSVRVLCLDPDSEQAKFRSYREALLRGDTLSFKNYLKDKDRHSESTLFRHTSDTLKLIADLLSRESREKEKSPGENEEVSDDRLRDLAQHVGDVKCQLQAWKYSCAPACFMLRVDDKILFEPYSYGKLDRKAATPTLGGDMPVFEFHRYHKIPDLFDSVKNRSPWELLDDHFRFVTTVSESIIPNLKRKSPPVAATAVDNAEFSGSPQEK
jgi:hypothetical protein